MGDGVAEMVRIPQVLGHRGAMGRYPENTLLSILGALEDQPSADGVEFDVRLTSDGVPVVFHDDTTERLTGQPGTVESRTSSQLEALRVDGQPIPTLETVVSAIDRVAEAQGRELLINVELKPTGSPDPLVAAVEPILAHWLSPGTVSLTVSSFDPRVVMAARNTGWPLAYLYEDLDALAFLPRLEASGQTLALHPRYDLIDAEHLASLGDRVIRTWTVDDLDVAVAGARLGIDAIISNDPAALLTGLRENMTS